MFTMPDPTILKPYLTAWGETRRLPRFDLTSPYSCFSSGVRWFLDQDCLVVFGRGGQLAILPPISKNGDIEAERRVFRNLIGQGYRFIVGEEDLALYGIRLDALPPWLNVRRSSPRDEPIYRSGDILDLAGSKHRQIRNIRNIIERMQGEGRLTITATTNPNPKDLRDAMIVTNKWCKERDLSKGTLPKKHIQGYHAITAALGIPIPMVIMHDSKVFPSPVSLSIGELINPKMGVITFRYHDYHAETFSDFARAVHLVELQNWCKLAGPDVLLNIGMCGGCHDLMATKEKNRPCEHNLAYEVGPHA